MGGVCFCTYTAERGSAGAVVVPEHVEDEERAQRAQHEHHQLHKGAPSRSADSVGEMERLEPSDRGPEEDCLVVDALDRDKHLAERVCGCHVAGRRAKEPKGTTKKRKFCRKKPIISPLSLRVQDEQVSATASIFGAVHARSQENSLVSLANVDSAPPARLDMHTCAK